MRVHKASMRQHHIEEEEVQLVGLHQLQLKLPHTKSLGMTQLYHPYREAEHVIIIEVLCLRTSYL